MKSGTKITLYILFSLIVVGIGVFVSLIQDGKLKISADIIPQTQTTVAPTVSNYFVTGSNIWINVLVMVLLIAGVGYFIFKSKEFKVKK